MTTECINLIPNSSNLPKLKYIIHIADIHIRNNYARDDEYRKVFNKFYEQISNIADSTKNNTAIVICGDLTHDARYDKGKISANVIVLLNEFLKNLSRFGYVIVIPGNHDNNITHQERSLDTTIDVLSSVLENHTEYNNSVFYIKDSGKYLFGNCIFYHTSVFDIDKITTTNDYEIRKKFLQKKIDTLEGGDNNKMHHIGLLHCSIDGATTATSYILKGQAYKIADINELGYDLCLLGDVHEHQYLNDAKTVAYPSSLVQQNFGETIDKHGFILWKLPSDSVGESYTSHFHNVANIYTHTTITINNDDSIEELMNTYSFTENSYIKIVIEVPKPKEFINNLRLAIDKKTTIIKWSVIEKINTTAYDIDLSTDIANTETFTKYLTTLDMSGDDRSYIEELHLKKVSLLPTEITINNKISWLSIEINNFRGYVGTHSIDFNDIPKHSKISINGENANGKSTILDAFSYCLWGYRNTASLKSFVNSSIKALPEIKVCFIDNSTNDATCIKRVVRKIKSKGKGATVSLEQYDKQNKKWNNLSGNKKQTEIAIEKLVGSQKNAIHTFISKQNEFDQFINDPSTEFLSELLNCDLYLELSNEIKNETKKQRREISKLEGKLEGIVVDIKSLEEIAIIEQKINNYIETISVLTQEITDIEDKIKQIDIAYNGYSNNNTKNLKSKLITKEGLISKCKKALVTHEKKYQSIQINENFYQNYNVERKKLKEQLKEIRISKEALCKKLSEVEDINITTENKQLTIKSAEKQELLDTIVENISKISNFKTSNRDLGINPDDFKNIEQNYTLYNTLSNSLQAFTQKLANITERLADIDTDIKDETGEMTFNQDCADCNGNCDRVASCHKRKRKELVIKQSDIIKECNDIRLKISNLDKYIILYDKMLGYNENISKIEKINSNNNSLNKTIENLDFRINTLEDKIKNYTKNKNKRKQNKKIAKEIENKADELTSIQDIIDSDEKKYNTIATFKQDEINYNHKKKDIVNYEEEVGKINELLKLQINYDEQMTIRENFHKNKLSKSSLITDIHTKIAYSKNILQRSETQSQLKLEFQLKMSQAININRLTEKYLNIIDTTGFPNYIIKQTLPLLANNVNKIVASMGFDFICELSISDNNKKIRKDRKVNIDFIKNSITFKPSGSEVFGSSIAFRIALSKLAQHTSSNLFWIDEGFGSLDKKHQDCLDNVFEYIRNEFDYLVYISHIEYIKNKADVNIEINNFTIKIK